MVSAIRLSTDQSLAQRIKAINWGLVLLIVLVASVGFASLYSAAGADFNPWALKQMIRFGVGLVVMFVIALIDIKWWFRLSWLAYFVGLGLLVLVELIGNVGMGAQRWIDLGFIQLQPSEVMKIAVIMALARYFHRREPEDMRHLSSLIIPAIAIAVPVALVMMQPDLGTALMIIMAGAAMIFIAGAPLWLFISGAMLAAASIPVAWHLMHDYQKSRVMIFLNPEKDPLGAGYHITQSKIALGSGGVQGKGFLEGSQSHLNFLPEKQTDFIFTLWAEEWGLFGGVALLALFAMIFLYGINIALRCRSQFARYLSLGLMINFSLYVFINIGMVMGLLPVVGVPLPLVSYGGTSMLVAMASFGLIMSCSIYHDSKVTGV